MATGQSIRFAKKIDREPDSLRAAFAECFHHILGISSSDELARHSGHVPA